eukprot:5506938-Prymnesium_polylepis.2
MRGRAQLSRRGALIPRLGRRSGRPGRVGERRGQGGDGAGQVPRDEQDAREGRLHVHPARRARPFQGS